MGILWCGGEDIDFPNGALANMINESSASFRAGYARHSLSPGTGEMMRSTPFIGGAITSAWLSFRLVSTGSETSKGCVGLGLSGTFKGLFIGCGASGGKAAILKYDGSTWSILATEVSTTSLNKGASTFSKYDVEIISYGASATVNLYLNSNLIVTYTGDVTVSGVSNLDSVFLINNPNSWFISEIIVSSEDTRNMSLVTCYPNAAGDTLEWTGAYTTVDEATISDADLAYDNTDGHRAMYNLSAVPSGSFSVLAVREAVRACRSSDSTPTSLNLGVKSGGSVNVADNHALSVVWTTYERIMATNPVTAAAFTQAEVDALQFVMESEA